MNWHNSFDFSFTGYGFSDRSSTGTSFTASETNVGGADWVIHQDADEILQSPTEWGGLRRSIECADARGFNVMNFNELVMLPSDPAVDDFLRNNTRYYFFEPRPLRLMRAWKKSAGLSNIHSGGHALSGDVVVSPERMLLKHFIVRSQKTRSTSIWADVSPAQISATGGTGIAWASRKRISRFRLQQRACTR